MNKKILALLTLVATIFLLGFVTDTVFAEECGNGYSPGQDKVLICHKPGTPAQMEKRVPESALSGHLGHGDHLGPCKPLPGPTPTEKPPDPTEEPTPGPTETPSPTDTPTPQPTEEPTEEPTVPVSTPEEKEEIVVIVEEAEVACDCCCDIIIEGDNYAAIVCGDNNVVNEPSPDDCESEIIWLEGKLNELRNQLAKQEDLLSSAVTSIEDLKKEGPSPLELAQAEEVLARVELISVQVMEVQAKSAFFRALPWLIGFLIFALALPGYSLIARRYLNNPVGDREK